MFKMKKVKETSAETRKKIWIDMDNSPHVPFFKPIIEKLKKDNYEIVLTARDCFQVCGLADLFQLDYKRIGRHYGKNKFFKVIGLLIRSMQLAPFIFKEKPNLAVSHGSRSQLLLTFFLGIRTVEIGDYEYSTDLPFIYPDWAIAPEVIPTDRFHYRTGIRSYPGIKEDVYVSSFVPDPKIIEELGMNDKDLIVCIRPPATEAHYHNSKSEALLNAIIDYLGQKEKTRMILVPRSELQTVYIKEKWPELISNEKIIIPQKVYNGLDLIWCSDIVISGGGTMNREAAALGVPVYSIFKGQIGAVDKYLMESGRLTFLNSVEDVRDKIRLLKFNKPQNSKPGNGLALQTIVDEIKEISTL